MSTVDVLSSVYLGRGGPQPGVYAVSGLQDPVAHLCSFEKGHSVYALGVDGKTGLVAAGTRAGKIECLNPTADESPASENPGHGLYQGAPILSLCCLDDRRLAVADTAGRCFLWTHGNGQQSPRLLESGRNICSLTTLGASHLVGLVANGQLVFWALPDVTVQQIVECPKPPSTLGLVTLTYWPAQDAIAFPGVDGRLVFCGPDGGKARVFQAHRDEFYVAAVNGENLYTVGRWDGKLRVWRSAHSAPAEHFTAPMGITSGQFLGGNSRALVLAAEDGQAGIYLLGPDGLTLRRRLEGGSYRVIACAPADARQAREEKRRQTQARRIASQIREHMDNRSEEPAEALHTELVALGFGNMSLGLRAQWARRQEDISTELCVRHELVRGLPLTDLRSRATLQRYVSLLDTVWQPAEAQIVSSHGGLDENAETKERRQCTAAILEGDDWVVELDVPLSSVISATSLFGKRFRGRWLLDVAKTTPLPDGALGAEAIAIEYEELRALDGREELPRARPRPLWWLRRSRATRNETILFTGHSATSHGCFELAVRVHCDGLQAHVDPCVLFHPDDRGVSCDTETYNRGLLASNECKEAREQFDLWSRGVLAVLTRTLRRLSTRALALRPRWETG